MVRVLSFVAFMLAAAPVDAQSSKDFRDRGTAHFLRGDYERALQEYDQAIKADSRDATALDNRCWTRAVVSRLEEALQDCNRSLSLRPNSVGTLSSRGFVYLKMGKFDLAIADYDRSMKLGPKEPLRYYTLYGRGLAKLRKGDSAGGTADIAASKALKDVSEEFARYGVK